MTVKSYFFSTTKRSIPLVLAAVLLLSSFTCCTENAFAGDEKGTLIITTTTENGTTVMTGDGKPVIEKKDKGKKKIPLYKSKKKLGAYIDRQMSKHKKTIVFSSWNSKLMTSDDYNSVSYRLEYYSFMLAGIKPRIRTEIKKDLSRPKEVTVNGKKKIKYPTQYKIRIKYTHSKAADRRFYKKVRRIVKLADRKKTSRAKAKFINKYVIDHIKGDDRAWKNNTAYKALTKKRATCQGYSEAFKVLARASGLKAETVMGRLYLGKGKYGNHAWNIVKIKKKWYSLDVSWNDQKGKKRNKYLLVKQKKFQKKRKPFSPYRTKKWKKAHPMKQ